jgi:hypothetical protein
LAAAVCLGFRPVQHELLISGDMREPDTLFLSSPNGILPA